MKKNEISYTFEKVFFGRLEVKKKKNVTQYYRSFVCPSEGNKSRQAIMTCESFTGICSSTLEITRKFSSPKIIRIGYREVNDFGITMVR